MNDSTTVSEPEPSVNEPDFTLVRSSGAGKLLRIPHGYMTGGMAREYLGITESQFRSMTQKGLLESTKRNARGWCLYAEEDIKAYAKDTIPKIMDDPRAAERKRSDMLLPATISACTVYSRQEAVVVFALIRAGKNLVDIVLETGHHPAAIMSIARDFVALENAIFLDARTMALINALPLEGEMPLRKADDVLRALRVAASDQQCRTPACGRPRGVHCAGCLQARIVTAQTRKAAKAAKAAPQEPSVPGTSVAPSGSESDG